MKIPLSRSISKSTILHHCTKKYYFSTYSNHLKSIDWDLWNQAMLAKNLKSIYMRFGERIHDLMSDYLHLLQNWTDTPENIKKIKNEMTSQMDIEYKISKNRDYSRYQPSLKFWLTDHYYQKDIDEIYTTWKHNLLESFDKFLESDFHDRIKQDFSEKSNRFFIEPKEKDFESMKIEIDNIPELMWISVYAQPDFGIITKDWTYIIYDRKSGRTPTKPETEVSQQLHVYAYKILQKIWIEKINTIKTKGFEFYIKSLSEFWWTINKSDLQNIEQKIIDDTKTQKTLIINWDVEENKPLPTKEFPRTTDIQKCSNCTFYKVCEALKQFEN